MAKSSRPAATARSKPSSDRVSGKAAGSKTSTGKPKGSTGTASAAKATGKSAPSASKPSGKPAAQSQSKPAPVKTTSAKSTATKPASGKPAPAKPAAKPAPGKPAGDKSTKPKAGAPAAEKSGADKSATKPAPAASKSIDSKPTTKPDGKSPAPKPGKPAGKAADSKPADSKPEATKGDAGAKPGASKPAPGKPAPAKAAPGKPAPAKAEAPAAPAPAVAATNGAAAGPAAATDADGKKPAPKGITIVTPKPVKKPKAKVLEMPIQPLLKPGLKWKPLIPSGPKAPPSTGIPGVAAPLEYKIDPKARMNKKELDRYREILLQKRSELVGDIANIEDEALRASSGSLSTLPQHMAEQGSDAFDQAISLDLAQVDRHLLREIDAALKRIDDGTYGICERTGKRIAPERLAELPWARYSIEAAREMERRPAHEREEASDEEPL